MKEKEILQSIAAVSKKVNDIAARLDDALEVKTNNNAEAASDAQNATIDLGLELISLLKDKELADEVAKRIQLV